MSLLDFLLHIAKRVNTFVSIEYTKYTILTTVNLDFDVKQVPWTHGQGIESTDPIGKVSAGDDADTQCSGGAAIRHSEAGDSWPAKRYDSKAIHFPSGDQEAALSP